MVYWSFNYSRLKLMLKLATSLNRMTSKAFLRFRSVEHLAVCMLWVSKQFRIETSSDEMLKGNQKNRRSGKIPNKISKIRIDQEISFSGLKNLLKTFLRIMLNLHS